MVSTTLAGPWRAHPTSDDLRRNCIEHDFDDSPWHSIDVPGHWASNPALSSRTSVLYRTQFELDADISDDTSRQWLLFDGIWDRADIWLDGNYLGPTAGWFLTHEFEITELVRSASNLDRTPAKSRVHTLVVEVASPVINPNEPGRSLHGLFAEPSIVGHSNPGGIWQPVRIVSTGAVRMTKNRVICTAASDAEATIHLRSHLISDDPTEATITTTLRPPAGAAPITSQRKHHLVSGATVLEWDVHIPSPKLWWPWSLGDQPLYRVTVSVEVNGTISGIWERTVGLREIEMNKWVLSINGTRLFCKGVDLWPTSALPATATADQIAADISMAREIGLDLVRLDSHVARPELYETADRLGMLIWQDLPMRGEVKRSIQSQAVNAAHRLVDQLGAHPSIVMWCAHNDPTGTTTGPRPTTTLPTRRSLFGVAKQQVPTWTKSVLDRLVGRAFDVADTSRPVVHGSGTWPSAPKFDGTDTHLRFGWNNGTGRDLEAFARRIPRMVRWVSSFGAQSIPVSADVAIRPRNASGDWRPDLGLLADRYGLSETSFRHYLPATGTHGPEEWIEASQGYQAILLRRQIETLRRLKYKPTGGFTFAALADSRPAISFAIYDHDRNPKHAVEAVRSACQPVIVVADRLPAELDPGDAVLLDVHIVSDLPRPLENVVVLASLETPTGVEQWAWRGEVAPDSVARLGSINWIVPEAGGVVELSLEARSGDHVLADNGYRAHINA